MSVPFTAQADKCFHKLSKQKLFIVFVIISWHAKTIFQSRIKF